MIKGRPSVQELSIWVQGNQIPNQLTETGDIIEWQHRAETGGPEHSQSISRVVGPISERS
jgi:hypothetical protein